MSEWKNTTLGNLPRIRDVKTKRISSWDKTGGNVDRLTIKPGETAVLADISGAGVINHFWCTTGSFQKDYLRRIVLKMRWDNEENYSIEVPLGDFFGVGHAMKVEYSSMPLQMAPQDGKGLKSPMSVMLIGCTVVRTDKEIKETMNGTAKLQISLKYFTSKNIHERNFT